MGTVAAVMLACAVYIYLDEAPFAAKAILIAIFGFVAIAILSYVGGFRYEVYSSKLVIRVGFFRIPVKKIALDSIVSVGTDKYAFRSSKTTGYTGLRKGFGYFSDFGGKVVVIRTHSARYLLASNDPKGLQTQIEKYVNIGKLYDTESG